VETRAKVLWAAGGGLVVFLLDRLSKVWVVETLDLRNGGTMEVFPGLLTFRMVWNKGVNFGLFSGESDLTRWVLAIVALGFCAFLGYLVLRSRHPLEAGGYGLAIGGALGNLWDRFQYGAVADFLNVTCCGIHNPWSFNVADIAVFAVIPVVLWPWKPVASRK
jgi:signal peptidase II